MYTQVRFHKVDSYSAVFINPCSAEPGHSLSAFANSVDPDQLASEEAN